MSVRMMLRAGVGLCVLGACGVLMALAEPGNKGERAEKPAPAPAPAPAGEPSKDEAKKKADTKSLAVGDAAPKLSVEKWVKGEAVNGFEAGKVYVVEFWATWCGPCIRSIPHLSELQKKHEKVVFIGVASSERKEKDGTDKRLEKVTTFVEGQGEKMAYRVAFDEDRDMADNWLKAAGKSSIPTAFIVNGEGKVAWIGHPNKLDSELEKVLDAGALGGKDVKDRHEDKH